MPKRGTLPDRIERLQPGRRKGLVVVLTGYGKGNSTSTPGIALRA